MAAKKTHADKADIKQKFEQILARKNGSGRDGVAHTDGGSRVAPRIPVARKQSFRRKSI
ncbi:DUF5302 domain-containing protein [Actinokineospora enzanensis]|uniref:DUF5302 domain-containing protein n=1 Tax=Actinokineospora enzanensis TaxID=155975 RepID=UPI000382EC29|nr:DUF5302 domain-containing protein [Actinokineospora enzanensis]